MPIRPSRHEQQLAPAQRFRPAIEKAKEEGGPLSNLVLQLTLGDAAKLKRDPGLSTEDISFVNGEMRYLGVKVMEGGVASSELIFLQK